MKIKFNIVKSVGTVVSKGVMKLKKHSPEILIVTGVAGVIASAVMACKASTKLETILSETKETLDTIHEGVEAGNINEHEYTPEDGRKDTTIIYVNVGMKFLKKCMPLLRSREACDL